jgi:CopZ-like zinc binding protein
MSGCCSVEGSADTCANVGDKGAMSRCAECGTEGRPIDLQTILHHVKHEQLEPVNGKAYRFCSDPNCEIVYFADSGTCFTVNDLRELVTVKTTGDKRPICYCFGFNEGDARKEIELTGGSTIPSIVNRLIKAGMCACEIRNPSGACCLGEVNRTVKRLSDEREPR